jgi:signal transduction histidine kinase
MSPQKPSYSWSSLGVTIAAVVVSTCGIATLNARSYRAANHERELNHLQAIANRLDALEWRAISKKQVDSELEEALRKQQEQAQRSLDALKTTTPSLEEMQKVESAYQAYATAVNQLLKLLESNRIEQALEVDKTQVDPNYEKLYEIVIDATTEASQRSANLTYWANFGFVLIVLSQICTLGIVFLQQYLRAKQQVQNMILENMRRRAEQLEEDRQRLESRVQERTQELQQTNIALSEAVSELQKSQVHLIQSEKMSTLGQLVAGVAHEINNPVGFLAGNIQPALDYVKDLFGLIDLYQEKFPEPGEVIKKEIAAIDLDYIREDLPKLIGSMKEGVIRIRDISTSLRTFSRADSSSPVPYNIHEGIDSTLLILKYRLKANETRPAIEVVKESGNLPLVKCYAGQLNQVFMNLLANAIDALEESNQGRSFEEIKAHPNCIVVKTELSNDSQSALISIRDNGIGMSDEVKHKIFDHQFTSKAVGKGTGLGLAIARAIVVDTHGGTLEVHSTPGNGAEFAIAIPMKAKPKTVV